MTRPYFKKTLTLCEDGNMPSTWNSNQANAMSSASCPTSTEKSWHPATSSIGIGKHWKKKHKRQQAPGHHHEQWPLLVNDLSSPHPRWGCSSERKLDSGVPAKELQVVCPNSQVGNLHYSGTPHTGVCLRCLVSPQAPATCTGKSSTPSSLVHDTPLISSTRHMHGRTRTHTQCNAYRDRSPGIVTTSMLKSLKWTSLDYLNNKDNTTHLLMLYKINSSFVVYIRA